MRHETQAEKWDYTTCESLCDQEGYHEEMPCLEVDWTGFDEIKQQST